MKASQGFSHHGAELHGPNHHIKALTLMRKEEKEEKKIVMPLLCQDLESWADTADPHGSS